MAWRGVAHHARTARWMKDSPKTHGFAGFYCCGPISRSRERDEADSSPPFSAPFVQRRAGKITRPRANRRGLGRAIVFRIVS